MIRLSVISCNVEAVMQLTMPQREAMLRKLDKLWASTRCDVCQVGDYAISDRIFEMREYNGRNFVLGAGTIMPIVIATCQNCGAIRYVNAIQIGLVDPATGTVTTTTTTTAAPGAPANG
jgi:hypothetical protein